MRKNQNRLICLITFAVAISLSIVPCSYGQKPKKRGVVDDSKPPAIAPLQVGPYYALIIGNNTYQYLPKLQTAVNDANAVAKLLQERYGFAPPKVLINATRVQILTELNVFRHQLPLNSNLLIYYAGHGQKDPQTKKAYWLPVDAQADNNVNWISASTITEEISAISSAHVLVISDSCYSGELTRSAPIPIGPLGQESYLKRMLESPSRTLMSSGRDEPVADTGANGHSKFAYVVLESLTRIDEDRFTAADLFQRYVQPWVGGGGGLGGSEQVPQYSVILNSGHQYGDFVFSRKGAKNISASVVGGTEATTSETASLTTGPVVPPVVSNLDVESERNAIRDVLHSYEQAYNQLDSSSLWKVWPNPPAKTKQSIEAAFQNALSIEMQLHPSIPQIAADGMSATVKGRLSQWYTPKNGNPQPPRNDEFTVTLKKNDGAWAIVAVK